MVFTDPPYNVNYANSAKDKMRGKSRPIQNDNLGADFAAFLYDVCTNLMMVCKGAMYICMSSSELHTLHGAFSEAGGKWSTFIIWAKNTFTLGRADYQRQYEPILYGWKNGHEHFWCGARDQSDVWFPHATWEKDPSRNNEALDCHVYARAAASIYGIDRMSEFKWRSLEQSLGVEVEIPTRGVEIPVTEEVKATPPKPQTKKRVTVPQRKAVRANDPYL